LLGKPLEHADGLDAARSQEVSLLLNFVVGVYIGAHEYVVVVENSLKVVVFAATGQGLVEFAL
jgi:hypothetical protein